MKKAIAVLLFCALLTTLPSGCFGKSDAQNSITFTGIIEETGDGSILVSTTEDVGFDKASVGYNKGLEIPFNLIAGQTVKITILPEIRESYPVQVTATAIELVSDAPEPTGGGEMVYPVQYFRADSSTDDSWSFLMPYMDNSDKLVISSVQHLPTMRFEDAAALEGFVEAGRDYFQLETAYDGSISFAEAAADYGEAFFADHILVVALATESSGSNRHGVESVSLEDGCLSVAVRRTVPEIGTADMADWLIVVEIPREDLNGCEYADAYISQG